MNTECVKVTQGKIDSLISSLNVILNNYEQGVHYMHVKDIASVARKVISMEAGVGQVCRLKTKAMYECILSRSSWKGKVLVTKDVIEEVKFWLNNVVPRNGRKLTHRTSEYTRAVYSDASDIGFGAYIENVSGTDPHRALLGGSL